MTRQEIFWHRHYTCIFKGLLLVLKISLFLSLFRNIWGWGFGSQNGPLTKHNINSKSSIHECMDCCWNRIITFLKQATFGENILLASLLTVQISYSDKLHQKGILLSVSPCSYLHELLYISINIKVSVLNIIWQWWYSVLLCYALLKSYIMPIRLGSI